MILKGTCVCPGTAEGKLTLFQPGKKYGKDEIVLLKHWLTQEVLAAKDAGAVISAAGGITCHASIVARELNLPALISVDISSLKEGTPVKVNATKGTIETTE